ncbi:MAG: serine/threonine protein kinase [Planctomycetes bacterium]|nr:serine/threonine protein kinase [Planctomycetota bacterium]
MSNTSDSGLHIQPLPKLGQEVGRFLIENELPRGGQARVYRAWQTDLQRPVALKLLPSSYAANLDTTARFKREIENVARISHPNVVRVYEAGEVEGHPFFTMELIDGHDAETLIKRGAIDPDEGASIIEAVARGVEEAHQSGIIHRDIKPGNIILRKDDTPVLTDFGLAQDLTHSEQLTQTGISMGTPAYMAPEQARGERNRVGKKSDIYALGATLFTLLTGKRPAEGASTYELMLKVAESQGPKWPRQALEDVPPDLRAIVEMAMQNDPGKRYDSAKDLADDLERYLHGEWVVARSRSMLAKLWIRTRRFAPVAAVVIVTLALAGGMVYTGLNPAISDNTEAPSLGVPETLSSDFKDKTDEELEKLFDQDGTWAKTGASVERGSNGELVLSRSGPEPITISPRTPACWGDFTLQTEFELDGNEGPLEFLVGMPDSNQADETAYTISIGAESRDRLALHRLGIGVYSAYTSPGTALLTDNRWYRATIKRSGQVLEFTLVYAENGLPLTSFTYEDAFPALVSGHNEAGAFARQRFGIRAQADVLMVRDVTVSHRDNQHTTEALLFSVGQFAEAELRLTARLNERLARSADAKARNDRAELLYLRARCLTQLNRPEDALADCAEAKLLINDAALRAKVFLLCSQLETQRGDDASALAQLRVAQLNTSFASSFNTIVYNDAHSRARQLAQTEPDRALAYFDYVSTNALGSPWLVCDALYHGARIRLASDDEEARKQGLTALERIEGENYRRFGGTFGPAMVLLFEQRWETLDSEAAELDQLVEVADWLSRTAGTYGVDDSILIAPLVRANWLGRLISGPGDRTSWDRATDWLDAAKRAEGDDVWLELQEALMGEERPEYSGTTESRVAKWRALAAKLTLEDPRHGVLSAICEYFIGSPLDAQDLKRRNDVLRRALRNELKDVPGFWFGDIGAQQLAEYCIALYAAPIDREGAVASLEEAADAASAGALVLLKDRAEQWLPIPR